jgi:hypothetical protein
LTVKQLSMIGFASMQPLSNAERALMARLGKLGGDARAKKLSKARQKAIARMGGKARAAKRGNGS